MSAIKTLTELNDTFGALPAGDTKDALSKSIGAFIETAVVSAGFTPMEFRQAAGLRSSLDELLEMTKDIYTLGLMLGLNELADIGLAVTSAVRSTADLQFRIDKAVFDGNPVFSVFKSDTDLESPDFGVNHLARMFDEVRTAKVQPTIELFANMAMLQFGRAVGYTGHLSGAQLFGMSQDVERVLRVAARLPSYAQRLAHPGLAGASLAYHDFIATATSEGKQFSDATGIPAIKVFGVGADTKAQRSGMAIVLDTMRKLAGGTFVQAPITQDQLDKLERDIKAEQEQYTQ